MDNILSADEIRNWEYQITKEERLILTSKRLYLVSSDGNKISVIFRKAITGCEYKYTSYILGAIISIIIGILVSLAIAKGSTGSAFICFIIFLAVGLGFMCKEEKLTINLAGGANIKLVRRQYFAINFKKELDARIKDISALEDV